MYRLIIFPALLSALLMISCGPSAEKAETKDNSDSLKTAANAFLESYNKEYQDLYYRSSKAEWAANTHIVQGDTATKAAVERANKAYADFTGSEAVINTCRGLLKHEDKLEPLVVKQLKTILYNAGANPATAGDKLAARIKADAEQTEKLFGFFYTIDGDTVSTNDIDDILNHEQDLDKRLKAWNASKEVGVGLKEGLLNLRDLRNGCVQALGYDDYFAYQVSDYGMTTEEMQQLCHQMIRDIWPLFRELHTWARYELAERYHQPVPEMLPAEWLPNRWGQDWTGLVDVKGVSLDPALKEHGAEWIVKQGDAFYTSLGFDPLPEAFYANSSLYPLPKDAAYLKNNHASAWHMDLDKDVRSLMSVEPNTEWWETVLHELGHIHYYRSYSRPEVPLVLRGGANRGYHEAMGSLLGLASMQKPFLIDRGLIDSSAESDDMQIMLKEALNYIVLIPWGAGVMTDYEESLYGENLPADQMNAKWWALKKKYLGIVPPELRGEHFCDAASKTHINNDPAQYYDYAISYVLLFQFHDYIAKQILHQDPHATNYWGNKEVGDFLKKVMEPGATVDWREHLKNTIGSEMTTKPMLEYFAPLMAYLKEQNKGRKCTLPETI